MRFTLFSHVLYIYLCGSYQSGGHGCGLKAESFNCGAPFRGNWNKVPMDDAQRSVCIERFECVKFVHSMQHKGMSRRCQSNGSQVDHSIRVLLSFYPCRTSSVMHLTCVSIEGRAGVGLFLKGIPETPRAEHVGLLLQYYNW